MSGPPIPPPYGALIEEAREKAGLSRRKAARRAGISDAWWRYVASGHQGQTPVRGSAEAVAAMARAVGLAPERLESEGQRPDAAEILREILRSQPGPPRSPRLAAVPDHAPLPDDPSDLEVALFVLRQEPYSKREMLWRTWDYFGSLARAERLGKLRSMLDPMLPEEQAAERRREPGA